MSGGRFEYREWCLKNIAEAIQSEIDNSGRQKTKEELREERWRDYENYPEDKFLYKYPDEVIEEFKKGVEIMRKAYIYARRIDYLLSGDDGEESFLERLNIELNKLKDEKLNK